MWVVASHEPGEHCSVCHHGYIFASGFVQDVADGGGEAFKRTIARMNTAVRPAIASSIRTEIGASGSSLQSGMSPWRRRSV
jgi:hypothetical protein